VTPAANLTFPSDLTAQRQERYWRLEDVATFDLDRLIHLIKREFMA
jgi:hypothetical protein